MTKLKHMILYIDREEIAEKLGVDAQEIFLSNIEINENTQGIEFFVTMSEDTVVKDDFETVADIVDVGNFRRQGIVNK